MTSRRAKTVSASAKVSPPIPQSGKPRGTRSDRPSYEKSCPPVNALALRPLARNAKRLGVRLRSLGAATKGAEWIEEFTMSLSGLTPQMNGEATERYQR
jgi:hypothetical protein